MFSQATQWLSLLIIQLCFFGIAYFAMFSGIVGFLTTFIEIAKRRCMSAYAYNAYFFLAMRLLSYISHALNETSALQLPLKRPSYRP